MVLEKILKSPLDSKQIKPVNSKGNQPWISFGRTDVDVEAPILWPPEGKSQLTGKDPPAGKDWGQEEKQVTEGETVGWHHQPNGHEFEQTPGDSEGQGNLVCCTPWGRKDLDTTYWTTIARRMVSVLHELMDWKPLISSLSFLLSVCECHWISGVNVKGL